MGVCGSVYCVHFILRSAKQGEESQERPLPAAKAASAICGLGAATKGGKKKLAWSFVYKNGQDLLEDAAAHFAKVIRPASRILHAPAEPSSLPAIFCSASCLPPQPAQARQPDQKKNRTRPTKRAQRPSPIPKQPNQSVISFPATHRIELHRIPSHCYKSHRVTLRSALHALHDRCIDFLSFFFYFFFSTSRVLRISLHSTNNFTRLGVPLK